MLDLTKIPSRFVDNVRESRQENGKNSTDASIADMTAYDFVDTYLRWNGIVGWEHVIIDLVRAVDAADNKQATQTTQETTMNTATNRDSSRFLDRNGKPLIVGDFVRSLHPHMTNEPMEVIGMAETGGQLEIATHHHLDGIRSVPASSVEFLYTKQDRIATLSEHISVTRAEAASVMHSIQRKLDEQERWDFDAKTELVEYLKALGACHSELKRLDPTNDYLTR